MARLTAFSRFIIVMLVLGALFFGGRYFLNQTSFGSKIKEKADDIQKSQGSNTSSTDNSSKDTYKDLGLKPEDVVKVGVVTWGGYAGGQYFNEGFKPSQNSRFRKEYGIDVDFKILDDFDASRAAWKKGEVDLLWTTVDAFPTEANALRDFEPRIVFQADWSRGGDAIVVRRGINSVAELKGKKIAVAELTPSHSFLLWLLEAGQLKMSDVQIVKQANAIDAASVFKSGQVDAAVVWSPDDEACVKEVPGSKILQSTKSASNIIADVFIAKKSWIDANQDKLAKLYTGWMRGASEINASDANKRKAAQILADNFPGFTTDDTYKAINNVRLCTHGDNLNFFGLNPNYKGVKGEELFTRMGNTYKGLGYIEGNSPNWRIFNDPNTVRNTTALSGSEHSAEGQTVFSKADESDKTKEAVATKRVSINFRSGEFILDENAKYIVDNEMVGIAKAFGNARIRIEGNTDNVGNAASNKALSLKRAQSVRDYLVRQYGMSANRFVLVGNGPDNPVGSNDTEEGKARNRRTDFEIIGE